MIIYEVKKKWGCRQKFHHQHVGEHQSCIKLMSCCQGIVTLHFEYKPTGARSNIVKVMDF